MGKKSKQQPASAQAEAERLKTKGNNALAAGDVKRAISLYSSAIELEPMNHVLYSNRAAAHGRLDSWAASLADAQRCTEIEPAWPKGHCRLGAALYGLDRPQEVSISDLAALVCCCIEMQEERWPEGASDYVM